LFVWVFFFVECTDQHPFDFDARGFACPVFAEVIESKQHVFEQTMRHENASFQATMNESSIALKVAMDTANRTSEARHAETKTTLREYATVRALSAVKDELEHQLEAHGQRAADLRADLENRATNRALDAVKEAAAVREQTVNAVRRSFSRFLYSVCRFLCVCVCGVCCVRFDCIV
jgi:hypothetical protein